MDIRLELEGLREEQKRAEKTVRDLHGTPMFNAIRESTLMVQRTARQLAPVDTGRLRASILPEITQGVRETVGIVGSNVSYAPYMELGTGIFVGRPAYFPPPSALDVWARRHGLASGYVVALAIYRAGGIRGRKFLLRAFQLNLNRIVARLERAIGEIID